MNTSALLKRVAWPVQVGGSLGCDLPPTEAVRRYHVRTKHQLDGFAAGPDVLDWDAQPQPFRHWRGAPRDTLPLAAHQLAATWQQAHAGQAPPHPINRAGVALLLEMALGLTAWKRLGPDQWALRANPSSGNLHPTEAHVICQGVPGLPDGLAHYVPLDHALEFRALGVWGGAQAPAQADAHVAAPRLWLGLSSIAWREAWKYGERAFRYCQLDVGHALGAVRYAAAALGWRAEWCAAQGHAELAHAMGLDRPADVGLAETEEPEGLIALWIPCPPGEPDAVAWPGAAVAGRRWQADTIWQGRASRLDPRPMYQWPVIEEVTVATRRQGAAAPMPQGEAALTLAGAVGAVDRSHGCERVAATERPPAPRAEAPLSQLLRERRSAQRFDRRACMAWDSWVRLMAPMASPRPTSPAHLPLDAWPLLPQVQLVAYAHRVEGLTPGAYLLPRNEAGLPALRPSWPASGAPLLSHWASVPAWPGPQPLIKLAEHPTLSGTLRTLSCHQAIASDACVTFSLIAPLSAALAADPAAYRDLLQEAGLIGQALYVRAEAEGLRGTGIGCYFDDAVLTLLGLPDGGDSGQGAPWQVLYHFTVGHPLVDPRLQADPPYDADRLALDAPFGTPQPGDDA